MILNPYRFPYVLTFVSALVVTGGTTISIDGSAAEGDLAILLDSAINTDDATIPTATTAAASGGNFTMHSNHTGTPGGATGIRNRIASRILTAADLGNNVTNLMSDNSTRRSLYIFRPNRTIGQVTFGGDDATSSAADPGALSCAASGGAAPLVVVAGYHSSGAITTRTFSPAADLESSITTTYYSKYKLYNSAPQDTSVDMGDYGTYNVTFTGYISVSE